LSGLCGVVGRARVTVARRAELVAMLRYLLLAAIVARAKIVEFPIERVDELTVRDFEAKYVRRLRPVVLRGNARTVAEAENWDLEAWRDYCGEGRIELFQANDESTEWGGFNYEDAGVVPLEDFLRDMKESSLYGFDYDIKCSCEAFVQESFILPYFKNDLMMQGSFGRGVWPVLIAGSAGTRSRLHVDSYFFPFWLTLLAGEKIFRAVALDEWREKLVPLGLYNNDGDALVAYDAFDDEAVRATFGGDDVEVFSTVLYPGDSVYIPVGALHGGLNRGNEPALAVTANFDDRSHRDLLLRHYCSDQHSLEHRINDKTCMEWAGVLDDFYSVDSVHASPPDAPVPMDSVYYNDVFCDAFRWKDTDEDEGRDRTCPVADRICPRRNEDEVVSRLELAVCFARISPRVLPGDTTYDELRVWVREQVADAWPVGTARPSARALDMALKKCYPSRWRLRSTQRRERNGDL